MFNRERLTIDERPYVTAVGALAQLSKLFSETDTPFIHSRFVERLYVANTGSADFSRSDMSFDARHPNGFGVGVKTFVSRNFDVPNREKIAEFTREGNLGSFSGLSSKNLATAVANLRNARVQADAIQYGIDLNNSIYHCLIRFENHFFVYEEAYSLIDISNIRPTDRHGNVLSKWPAQQKTCYFTDGQNEYSFSLGKSVLYKKFNPSAQSSGLRTQPFPVTIAVDPLASILNNSFTIKFGDFIESTLEIEQNSDFLVLPLYSYTKKAGNFIPERSGLNQWNAKGRTRSFGEAYIPIPVDIRKARPDFFPSRNTPFRVLLPNGKTISAKVCQDGGKALMSQRNADLLEWLFEIIDGSLEQSKKRLPGNRAYTYEDLITIGRDSVRIRKMVGPTNEYEIELAPLGSYEDFLGEL